jgi:hypothetical protein
VTIPNSYLRSETRSKGDNLKRQKMVESVNSDGTRTEAYSALDSLFSTQGLTLTPDYAASSTAVGELTDTELDAEIAAYEKKFGFSSKELLQMEQEGNLPDDVEIRIWRSWLQARGD